ncbi:MAG: molecular chaperone DnaJ, partial [Defluviitaleaceae bacterium]|nr:molecular chaperone DnaJ [Defluviitaleaceae bacterium]
GPRRGADIHTSVNIKFEDAAFGIEREIQINANETCETCKGSGAKAGTTAESCKHCGGSGQERIAQQTMFGTMTSVRTCNVCRGEGKIIKDPCQTCKGAGRVRQVKKIKVTVPKGIENGQSIRISGKGEAGEKGGPMGDLLITVYVQGHKLFTRPPGSVNLLLEMPVSFTTAALGGEISIPILGGDGQEKYTVKPGTQPGTKISLRGKGVPNVKNNRVVGDLIVTLNVTVPTGLNERQRQLLREFAEESGEEREERKGFFDKFKK